MQISGKNIVASFLSLSATEGPFFDFSLFCDKTFHQAIKVWYQKRPEKICSFQNLAVNHFTFSTLRYSDKFANPIGKIFLISTFFWILSTSFDLLKIQVQRMQFYRILSTWKIINKSKYKECNSFEFFRILSTWKFTNKNKYKECNSFALFRLEKIC